MGINMNKRALRTSAVAVALVVAALLVACFACVSRTSTTEASSDQGSSDTLPTIKIGADIVDPFFYKDHNGDYAGIDAEIAREACKRAGLTPKFVQIDWADRDAYLSNGTVDCLWCGYARNGREGRYLWTETYLETSVGVVVRYDDKTASLHDFDSSNGIAVRSGSISEFSLLAGALGLPATTPIKSYGTLALAMTAFARGYTDAWISYSLILDRLVAESPKTYRFLEHDALSIDLAVAFSTDYNGPYRTKLNRAIESMKRDGTIDKIQKRYEEATSLPAESASGSEADDA